MSKALPWLEVSPRSSPLLEAARLEMFEHLHALFPAECEAAAYADAVIRLLVDRGRWQSLLLFALLFDATGHSSKRPLSVSAGFMQRLTFLLGATCFRGADRLPDSMIAERVLLLKQRDRLQNKLWEGGAVRPFEVPGSETDEQQMIVWWMEWFEGTTALAGARITTEHFGARASVLEAAALASCAIQRTSEFEFAHFTFALSALKAHLRSAETNDQELAVLVLHTFPLVEQRLQAMSDSYHRLNP